MTCPVQGLTGTSKALACGSKSPRWIGLAASRPEQCRNPERSGSLLLSWSRGGGDVFHLSRSFVPLAGVFPGLDIETIGRALILLTQKGSLTLTSLTHKDFGKGSTAISTGRRFRIFFPLTSSTRSHVIAIPLYLSLRQLSSYQSMSWLNDIHARFSPRFIVFVTFVLVMLSEELVIFRGRPKLVVPSIGGREKYERETGPHDLCRKIGPSHSQLSQISRPFHTSNQFALRERSICRSDRDLKIDEDSLGARSLPEQHIHNIKAELRQTYRTDLPAAI